LASGNPLTRAWVAGHKDLVAVDGTIAPKPGNDDFFPPPVSLRWLPDGKSFLSPHLPKRLENQSSGLTRTILVGRVLLTISRAGRLIGGVDFTGLAGSLVQCRVPAMAIIAPFRALRYDPRRVDLAQVVTQPYDKISPEMQEHYYAASPYNLVRIILGKLKSSDGPADNVYTRAAGYFREWRRQGIFLQDSEPSVYGYVQDFKGPDQQARERRGFIALGRIEDYADNVVFRHEQTLAKPKADRLELLRSTRAHLEQLFVLYRDPGDEIDRRLATSSQPDISIRDEYGVQHRVWQISDSQAIAAIQAAMASKKLIIADGHHR